MMEVQEDSRGRLAWCKLCEWCGGSLICVSILGCIVLEKYHSKLIGFRSLHVNVCIIVGKGVS